MVGPVNSDAPLHVRQNVYMYDIHPRAGEELTIPTREGFDPFLYIMAGEIVVGDLNISKYEAITDKRELSQIKVTKDATLVLFLVDRDTPISLIVTISGLGKK